MKMNSRRGGHIAKFHMIRIGDLAAVPQSHSIVLFRRRGFPVPRRVHSLLLRRRNQPSIRRLRRWPQQSASHVRSRHNKDRKRNQQGRAEKYSLPCHCRTDSNSTPNPRTMSWPVSTPSTNFDAQSLCAGSNAAPAHSRFCNPRSKFHTARFYYGTHSQSVENSSSHSVSC